MRTLSMVRELRGPLPLPRKRAELSRVPELPEVETVRLQLARVLEGSRITRVETSAPNYFFVTPPHILKTRLVGQRVSKLQRLGKYLIAHLGDESRLLLHLGMTGQFAARLLPHDEHVHVVLRLSQRRVVTLRDVRKFGKIEWIPPGKSSKRLDKLGPDALLSATPHLLESFRRRSIPIKTALLDQSIWAGVGNIYADEALFRAKISPTKAATLLKTKEVDRLREEVQSLLRQAIAAGGSTINDYLQPSGELGGFQDFHHVYGKQGAPCPNCGKPIRRIVVGGRSTHYCAACQR